MLARAILYALLLLPIAPASATESGAHAAGVSGDAHALTCVKVAVYDGTALVPLVNAEVDVALGGDQLTQHTDQDGWASFLPFSIVPTTAPGLSLRERFGELDAVRVRARLADHVPVSRLVGRDEHGAWIPLIPFKSGNITPVISAQDGGTVTIPGVGILTANPGALAVDCALLVIPVPAFAQSSDLSEEIVLAQYYIVGLNSFGNPVPGLILGGNGGLTLSVRRDILASRRPEAPGETVNSETWTCLLYDQDFSLIDSRPMPGSGETSRATIAVGEGLNSFEYSYMAVDDPCEWGPWELQYTVLYCAMPGAAEAQFICGHFIGSTSAETQQGEERTGEMHLDVEASKEVGVKAGTALAGAETKVGLKVTAGGSYSSTTTTLNKGTKSVSGRIDGQTEGELTPPASCLTGTFLLGPKRIRFSVWARRQCTTSGGSILSESKPLGFIDVWTGMTGEWSGDVHVDSSCGEECEDVSEVPENYRSDPKLCESLDCP